MSRERFDSLVETFLSFLTHNRGRSDRTAESYRLALDRLATFAQGRDPLELGGDELDLFAGVWLHKLGVGPRARRPYVAAVRTFFRWAKARGEVRSDAAKGLTYPKTGMKIPRLITLENAEKLMWAPDFSTFEGVRDAAILAILTGVGLRASGIAALNESSVLQDTIAGRPRLILKVREKGDKDRVLPLPAEADLMLRMYLEHPELQKVDRLLDNGDRVLFVSLKNQRLAPHEWRGEKRRLHRCSIYGLVRRNGKRCGVPLDQLHPHALRHLFGTELAESEVDLVTRQRLMGHADPKSTAIYDHTAMKRLTREVDRANPLSKMRTPVTELLAKLGPLQAPPSPSKEPGP